MFGSSVIVDVFFDFWLTKSYSVRFWHASFIKSRIAVNLFFEYLIIKFILIPSIPYAKKVAITQTMKRMKPAKIPELYHFHLSHSIWDDFDCDYIVSSQKCSRLSGWVSRSKVIRDTSLKNNNVRKPLKRNR